MGSEVDPSAVFDQLRQAVEAFRESHRDFERFRVAQDHQGEALRRIQSTLDRLEGQRIESRVIALEDAWKPEGAADKLRMEGAQRAGRAQLWGIVGTALGIVGTVLGIILGVLKLLEGSP